MKAVSEKLHATNDRISTWKALIDKYVKSMPKKKNEILSFHASLILETLSILHPDRSYSTNWEEEVFEGFLSSIDF